MVVMYKWIEDFRHQCRDRRWTVKEYAPPGSAVDEDPWTSLMGLNQPTQKAVHVPAASSAASSSSVRTAEEVTKELHGAVERLHDISVVCSCCIRRHTVETDITTHERMDALESNEVIRRRCVDGTCNLGQIMLIISTVYQ